MDQDYIKFGKNDWKNFQKKAILKEARDVMGTADNDNNPNNDYTKSADAPIGDKPKGRDTTNEFIKTFSNIIGDLTNNKDFAKVINAEQNKAFDTTYKEFKDMSKVLIPSFREAVKNGNVDKLNATLEAKKQGFKELAKKAAAEANTEINLFNEIAKRAPIIRGRPIEAPRISIPNIEEAKDFRSFTNVAGKSPGFLFAKLIPDIAAHMELNPEKLTEASEFGVKNTPHIRSDNYPADIEGLYKAMKKDPNSPGSTLAQYGFLPKLVDAGSKVIRKIRSANTYLALAAGIQKRQEVLKMMDTNSRKKLLADIASGNAFILDPDDEAFQLNPETSKKIKVDFRQQLGLPPLNDEPDVVPAIAADTSIDDIDEPEIVAPKVVAPKVVVKKPVIKTEPNSDDEAIDDTLPLEESMKKANRPGVGQIDTRGTEELYEERMVQDERQSKIVKINEGWKAYAAKNKGKKITGEGDKFNIVMG